MLTATFKNDSPIDPRDLNGLEAGYKVSLAQEMLLEHANSVFWTTTFYTD